MSDSNNSEGESDDGLDELLNFQPFSQQSHQQDDEDNDEKADGKGVVGALDASGSPDDEREGERKASSSSLAAGGGEHRGGGGEDDDRDFVAAIASKRADAATLPSEVTSTSQLFWYFKKPKNATPGKRRKRSNPSSDTEGTMIHVPSSTTKYHPCRTCDPGEAKGLAMPQEWDQEKKVLCQFIGIPMGEKNLYSRSTLIPFHNLRGYDYDSAGVVDPTVSPLDEGQDEGGAAGGGTTTGDDREEGIRGSGSEKVGWCPRLIARYEKQVVGENKKQVGGGNPEEAAKTAVFFLDRVLEHAREEERRLRLERREQREEQLNMEVDGHENGDNDDVDDHDHEEELEEPYTQNLNVGAPGTSMARLRTVERKKEPIRPGDVITYRSHLFVAGDKRGVKTTTVLAVDPVGDPILTLDNGDFLPPDTHVKRVKIVKGLGKGGTAGGSRLEDHPFGMFRAIEHFKLEKLGRIDDGSSGDFRSREARRVGQVLQKNMAELREKTKDMALPVDIMNRYRGSERIAGLGTAGDSKTKASASSKKNPSIKKGKELDVATTRGSEVRVTKRKVRIRESPDQCSSPDPGIEMKQTKVGKLTARDDDLDFDSSGEDEERRREPKVRTVGNRDRSSSYKSSGQEKKKAKKGRPNRKSPESGVEESNSEDEMRLKKRKVRIMDSPDQISLKNLSGRKETMRQKKAGLAATAGDDQYSDLLNSSSNDDEAPAMAQKNAHVMESIELLSSQDSSIQTKKTKQKNVGKATGDTEYAELLEPGSSEDDDPPTGPRPNGPGTKASRNSDIQKQTNRKKVQKRIKRQLKGNDHGEQPADKSVTNDKSQKRRQAKDVTVSPRGNAALVSSQTSSSDSSLDDFETPSRRTKISKGKQNSSTHSSSRDPPKSRTTHVGAGRTPPTRASPRKKTPEGADKSKQPRLRVTRQK